MKPVKEHWNYEGSGEPEITVISYTWDELRLLRNSELSKMDKYMISDLPITEDERNEILSYRQELRDLPNTYPDANNAATNWPQRPEFVKKFS